MAIEKETKYEHLLKLGQAIGAARRDVSQSELSEIYQTVLRHTPWSEIRKQIRARKKEVKAAWAVIWPDGRVLADSTFKDEAHAWQVALGWPDAEDIKAAKESGIRAKKIMVDIA